jgi:hypothetical protein
MSEISRKIASDTQELGERHLLVKGQAFPGPVCVLFNNANSTAVST